MLRYRRRAVVLLVVLTAVLLSLTVYAALRDTTPPQLYVEAPARLPVGASLALFASADEPVTLTLEYAGGTLQVVEQETTFDVPAAAGANVAHLVAVDGAGNETTYDALVIGVPALAPVLSVAEGAVSGDPLGIWVRGLPGAAADPLLDATVTDVSLTVAGESVPLRRLEAEDGTAEYRGAVATVMTVDPTTLDVDMSVVDEFGRVVTARRQVVLEPLPVTVEQLQIAPSVLAVVTPEGRDLEAQTIAAAWENARPDPLWTEPFVQPIEGVTSSGFGDARRYAQGGPVSFHYGLDLAAPQGTPIHATNDGVVVVAGPYPIKGGWTAIDHGDGVFSYYFHQSKILVAVGDVVKRGDVIGEVGTTGLSTGPHLHWEMRVRQAASNPLAWVGKTFP